MRIENIVKPVGFGTVLQGGYICHLPLDMANAKISLAMQANFNALTGHSHLRMVYLELNDPLRE